MYLPSIISLLYYLIFCLVCIKGILNKNILLGAVGLITAISSVFITGKGYEEFYGIISVSISIVICLTLVCIEALETWNKEARQVQQKNKKCRNIITLCGIVVAIIVAVFLYNRGPMIKAMDIETALLDANMTICNEDGNVGIEDYDINGVSVNANDLILYLTPDGQNKFEQFNADNVGKSALLFINGELVSKPYMDGVIISSDSIIISGFSKENNLDEYYYELRRENILANRTVEINSDKNHSKTIMEYDENGNPVKETRYDENGEIETYGICEYGYNGKKTSYKEYEHGNVLITICEFEYDDSDELIREYLYTQSVDAPDMYIDYVKENNRVTSMWYDMEGNNINNTSYVEEYDNDLVVKTELYDSGYLCESSIIEYDEMGIKTAVMHYDENNNLEYTENYSFIN